METGKTLDEDGFSIVKSEALDRLIGVEGPEIYYCLSLRGRLWKLWNNE